MSPPAHPEQQYLDLVRRVWEHGNERVDRTGVGTRSLFGATMRFRLDDDSIPLLTTKRVFWKSAVKELLWFLSGETNIRPLVEQGVHIWTDWPLDKYRRATGNHLTRDEFEKRILEDTGFASEWGDLGPVYGAQWVRWPLYVQDESSPGEHYRRSPTGLNQIERLIKGIRDNPASRRHIFTGWNVAELEQMALPPCHMTYQYHVADGKLSGSLYQRSCDLGLGFAFNIFEAALLLKMVAQQCDLEPSEVVWFGADVHLYLNHQDLVEEQLTRTPSGDPKLRIAGRPKSIFDYRLEDFVVEEYHPKPHIPAPVAV